MSEPGTVLIPAEPKGLLGAFDELLKRPEQLVLRERERSRSPRIAFLLVLGSVLAFGLYGATAGLYQGGEQVFVSLWKSPLIILTSLCLCLPSLYTLVALAGKGLSWAHFRTVVAGFTGVLALLLVALLPIAWLFSVSSRSLPFVIWLHVVIWVVAILFAHRFLTRSVGGNGAGGALFLWLILFTFVSFQVATYLRPVLWRKSGAPLFEGKKMFFLEHLGHAYDTQTNPDERGGAAREGGAR